MINSTTNSIGQAQLKSIANHGMTFMIILKEPDFGNSFKIWKCRYGPSWSCCTVRNYHVSRLNLCISLMRFWKKCYNISLSSKLTRLNFLSVKDKGVNALFNITFSRSCISLVVFWKRWLGLFYFPGHL